MKVSGCGECFSLTRSLYRNSQGYAAFHLSQIKVPYTFRCMTSTVTSLKIQSNISATMFFCVHKLKLTHHMFLPCTAKYTTQRNILKVWFKAYTTVHQRSASKLDFDSPTEPLLHLLNFVMASGRLRLCADSVYNAAPAPVSKFKGPGFSHITTQHPWNIKPPWAALLNHFTGAKILGYICVCEAPRAHPAKFNAEDLFPFTAGMAWGMCGWSTMRRDEMKIYGSEAVVKNSCEIICICVTEI